MIKTTRRKRGGVTGGVTGGGAYKPGGRFKTTLKGARTDTVYPGTVLSAKELAEQYQLMLSLKVEAQKQLRTAQQTARKLEKRENLLRLAEQVDKTASTLEDAVGRLHRVLHILVDFAQKPARPELPAIPGEKLP